MTNVVRVMNSNLVEMSVKSTFLANQAVNQNNFGYRRFI